MWKWPWSHVLTDVLMWDHAVKVVCRLWWCQLTTLSLLARGLGGCICLCVLCCRCPVGCGWVMMNWEHLGPVFPCINACSTLHLSYYCCRLLCSSFPKQCFTYYISTCSNMPMILTHLLIYVMFFCPLITLFSFVNFK